MIWKLLLTTAIIVGAFAVIRTRLRGSPQARDRSVAHPPLLNPALVRVVAYALLGLMVIGTLSYWVRDWDHKREIIPVRVVNANTGEVTRYRVIRGSLDGRRFVTDAGEEVRLADVERVVTGGDP